MFFIHFHFLLSVFAHLIVVGYHFCDSFMKSKTVMLQFAKENVNE